MFIIYNNESGTQAGNPTNLKELPPATGPADELIARLEGVISREQGRWYARCPAHDDRSPSLSICDTGERVLIYCHAGCAPETVLTAVGLEWKDLFPEPWTCARQRPHEAARRYAKCTLAAIDPLEIDRQILRIAVADIEAGKPLSVEDRVRIEVARERLMAAEVANG